MEHKTRDEIREVANILQSGLQPRPLSKRERLELWAEALEREAGRRLRTLYQIEYAPPAERAGGRADDSPLSVAFNHPGLRAAGLAGDTIGDATAFFGISERELHNIVCFCHSGETMSAETAAARVRTPRMTRARRMCVFTDVPEMPSSAAIAFVVFPAATARRISSWRSLRPSTDRAPRARIARETRKPASTPTARVSAPRPSTTRAERPPLAKPP